MSAPSFLTPNAVDSLCTDFSVAGDNKLKPDHVSLSKQAYQQLIALGVKKKTLAELLSMVSQGRERYGNCVQKSSYFTTIIYDQKERTIRNATNIRAERLYDQVGGDCQTLSFYTYDRLETSVREQLAQETGHPVTITIMKGTSRTHFITYPWFVHVYLLIAIGDETFIVDPAFGEVTCLEESGYSPEDQLYFSPDYLTEEGVLTSYTGTLTLTEEGPELTEHGQMVTIGRSANDAFMLHYSFAYEQISDTVHPVVNTVDKNGETSHSYPDPDTKNIQHDTAHGPDLDQETETEVEQMLKHLLQAEIQQFA